MFLDSAYIAKFYLNEPDSAKVRQLIQTADSALVMSEWSVVEVTCAFHRHLRQGELSTTQYQELLKEFIKHVDAEIWTVVPLNHYLVERTVAGMKSVPANMWLRSGDAVQLASAQQAGETIVWTNDRHLIDAAPRFGLTAQSAY